ncbi:MAG: family 10 glycosylhydrolase [Chlamydiota bacterium]|nr:family 10 glycosylhydrolase [Chlamydiota bacterium]
MRKYSLVFIIYLIVLFCAHSAIGATEKVSLALWVPCESANETLSSKEKIDELLRISNSLHVKVLYVQIYRRNHAWYPSKLANDEPYRNFNKKEGFPPIPYLIKQAHEIGIEVHLWFNMLRVGKDANIPIINTLGKDVITRDNKNRSILDYPKYEIPQPEGDYYSYAADGIWIEPGDPHVRKYLIDVLEEALNIMPDADGIHLDFIRFPFVSPFAPGSYYERKGISFGYGPASVAEFQKKSGLNVFSMTRTKENAAIWDEWRRTRITELIREINALLRKKYSVKKLSCAVLPWPERIYFNSFQDWPDWIEQKIVDYVVVMNYSTDRKLVRTLSKMALGVGSSSTIWMGLGPYLVEENPVLFKEQLQDAHKIGIKNLVLFSYDSFIKNSILCKTLADTWLEEN